MRVSQKLGNSVRFLQRGSCLFLGSPYSWKIPNSMACWIQTSNNLRSSEVGVISYQEKRAKQSGAVGAFGCKALGQGFWRPEEHAKPYVDKEICVCLATRPSQS